MVVPTFASAAPQSLLHLIARLKARHAIRDIPVILNSPMATNVRALYHEHMSDHRLATQCVGAVFGSASLCASDGVRWRPPRAWGCT